MNSFWTRLAIAWHVMFCKKFLYFGSDTKDLTLGDFATNIPTKHFPRLFTGLIEGCRIYEQMEDAVNEVKEIIQ